MTAAAGPHPWADAMAAAAALAVDAAGLGGAVIRARPGATREQWLAEFRSLLPDATAWRRLPAHIPDDRLLGGLDLPATLAAGKPVAERGLLADADGGVVVAPMAERIPAGTAARIAAVLDCGTVMSERDGLAQRHAARFAVLALDEGLADDEHVPACLQDRLAFRLELDVVAPSAAWPSPWDLREIDAAAAALAGTIVPDATVEALCAASVALGIGSARAPWLALRAARAFAALEGCAAVAPEHAALAARLVLGPRATRVPAEAPAEEQDAAPEPPAPADCDAAPERSAAQEAALADRVMDAARATLPAALLASLASGLAQRARSATPGKAGEATGSSRRGRPVGVRRGDLRAGARLNLLETLRAAAPWQPLRRRRDGAEGDAASLRLHVRPDDFRIARFEQRRGTTTIFAVDASGSAALHRLAEAKGAVQLLLADCYVRRDQVALVAFRGGGADLLLPPTRSLARTRRALAALPGGGGTPLAAGIDAAVALADSVRRKGGTPLVVMLTDGRANIARDGSPGRGRATDDARAAARRLRETGLRALVIDTSPQPRPEAAALAGEMGARYLPLPYADAGTMTAMVQRAGQA